MVWEKSKLIDGVVDKITWASSHAQVPTLLLKEDRLRVYFATRPKNDITLISFCDLDLNDFSKVLYIHDKPVLELGEPGTFDQFGIMPSSIIQKEGSIYLYYSGWCRSVGVPYNNYTGVAISEDGGNTFKKLFKGPVIDRTRFEIYSATSPEVYYENSIWHMWYCSGTNWHNVNGKFEHTYDLKYASSADGLEWKQHNRIVIPQKDEFEAITKPTVIKLNNKYHMWYCFRGTHDFRKGNEAYKIGYAESSNLVDWKRMDEHSGFKPTKGEWDSEMMAYPAALKMNHNLYLFYNGNDFGKLGFGYVKLIL